MLNLLASMVALPLKYEVEKMNKFQKWKKKL